MATSETLLIAPTAPEYAAIRSALRKNPHGLNLSLQRCGAGMQQARTFSKRLNPSNTSYLVLVGWAGGLSPDLNPGDIVFARRAITIDQEPVPCEIPAGIQDKLEQAGIGKTRTGDILTTPQVLATPESKLDAQQTAALAVEMEAYPLAAWSHAHEIPFVHARVILDSAQESLPDLGNSLDELGRPRILPILARILRKPSLLGQVWLLTLRIRQLNSRLAALADALIDVLTVSSEST